ncbi:hypothetical protein ABAC460_21715 [Asticcacaulis sp. AC460]|uniref:hypothetical protein n=1 Tax=Asticcacaulis sp. AC460 TaxID=1282360 RepID=UPI0003C3F241|nr:hypothetical protein [Asticcacaulis sp. AC460]ESQ87000.1 hypothetical protein ABAC460_21715 [Asticcacaulis sp. AC460]
MEKLWGRFWIRTLACLFGAPPIMLFCAIAAGVVINLVLGYGAGTELLPSAEITGYILIGCVVMALPLWIAMEILNRRWKRPLPPGIAAGYVATFVVVVMAILFVFAKSASLDVSRELAGISPLVVLGLTYIGAVLVTTGLASPIIQRWKKRTATAAELSGLF